MILLIRRKDLYWSALVFVLLASFCAVLPAGRQAAVSAAAAQAVRQDVVVVIDPGHGGEDGGAVSPNGVAESGVNLAVSLQIRDLMGFFGQRTVLTRDADESIADAGLRTMRERKASDIKNRVAIVNALPNAMLLSIHQNSLPSSPVTHGAQVFWNGRGDAQAAADAIQGMLNSAINTERAKNSVRISDGIYLMKHITAPGVLVECGFLSNAAETEKLQDPAYQLRLTSAIVGGYIRYRTGEGSS